MRSSRICDSVSVLKDGLLVGTRPVAEVDRDRLISMMVGRDMAHLYPAEARRRERAQGRPARPSGISVPGRVRDANLAAARRRDRRTRRTGRRRPHRTGAGDLRRPADVRRHVDDRRPALCEDVAGAAIALGIGLVTEDRKGQGLAMLLDVAANLSASRLREFTRFGLLDRARERAGRGTADRQLPHRLSRPGNAGRHDVRRQSAEGHRGALGAHLPARADPGRADARRRCGRQAGDLSHHPGAGGRRHRHPDDQLGTVGDRRPRRTRRRDARGPHHRRSWSAMRSTEEAIMRLAAHEAAA